MAITFDPDTKDPVQILRNSPKNENHRHNDYCSKARLETLDYRLTEDCRALRTTAKAFAAAGNKAASRAMTKLATALDKAHRAITTTREAIGADPGWLSDLPW